MDYQASGTQTAGLGFGGSTSKFSTGATEKYNGTLGLIHQV
jgi:hypothetical protein